MRRFLLTLLFRILSGKFNYQHIEDKQIFEWLASLYSHKGFRDYWRKRDLQILKTLGLGLQKDQYQIYLGQRLEILRLLEQVDRAYKIKQKIIKKRQKEAEKKAKLIKLKKGRSKLNEDVK